MLVRILAAGVRGFSLSRATTSRGLMPQSCRSTSPISPSSRKLLANNSWLGTLGRRMSSIGWQKGQWPRSCSKAAAISVSASSAADGLGESLVVGQLLEVQQRQAVDAQTVLEPRVNRRRIDQRHQAQLADAGQAAKVGRVDQLPHARRQRHVGLRRNPHQPAASVQGDDFGNVEDGAMYKVSGSHALAWDPTVSDAPRSDRATRSVAAGASPRRASGTRSLLFNAPNPIQSGHPAENHRYQQIKAIVKDGVAVIEVQRGQRRRRRRGPPGPARRRASPTVAGYPALEDSAARTRPRGPRRPGRNRAERTSSGRPR